jgi:hypothetical protein
MRRPFHRPAISKFRKFSAGMVDHNKLSFVVSSGKNRSMWKVAHTGNYSKDYELGNCLGMEYLRPVRGSGDQFLQNIVADMPDTLPESKSPS